MKERRTEGGGGLQAIRRRRGSDREVRGRRDERRPGGPRSTPCWRLPRRSRMEACLPTPSRFCGSTRPAAPTAGSPRIPGPPAVRTARGRFLPAHPFRRRPGADRPVDHRLGRVLRAAARRAAGSGQPAVPALPRIHPARPRDHRGRARRPRATDFAPEGAAAPARRVGRAVPAVEGSQPVAGRAAPRATHRRAGLGELLAGSAPSSPARSPPPRACEDHFARSSQTAALERQAHPLRRHRGRRPGRRRASDHTQTGVSYPAAAGPRPAGCRPLPPRATEWVDVPPLRRPGDNVGEMLEVATHGYLVATVHRVLPCAPGPPASRSGSSGRRGWTRPCIRFRSPRS